MSNNRFPTNVDMLIALLCIGFYAAMAVLSEGFVEPDEMSHFMKSMDALQHWHYVLDIWGRPFCIAYYAIGVPWGITFSRFLSIAASILTALGTIRLAYHFLDLTPGYFRSYRSWLWLLLFAQPYFMLQSFSVMTEILLSCFWIWAAVAVAHNRWLIAGLLVGLSGLTRPEGSLAVAAWPLFLIFSQSHLNLRLPKLFASSAVAIVPSFTWWVAGMHVFGGWNWFITHWPWAVESVYGKTPVEAVLAVLNAANFWMIIPIVSGLFIILKKNSIGYELRKRSIILLLIPVGSIFMLHFLLGVLGLFGSLSLPRYYITVSPFLAIIAWIGIEGIRHQIQYTGMVKWILIIIILLIPSRAIYMMDHGTLPFPKHCDQVKLELMINWFMENRNDPHIGMDQQPENIVAAHPYVNYVLSGSSNTPGSLRLFNSGGIKTAPAGTVLFVEDGVWKKNGFPSIDSIFRWNYTRVQDTRLDKQLADACDNDPLHEDMNIFVKK
ncbi:hypothetical protein JNL27_01015 [bacterium]|nr:hypothetical protein [bacterium]